MALGTDPGCWCLEVAPGGACGEAALCQGLNPDPLHTKPKALCTVFPYTVLSHLGGGGGPDFNVYAFKSMD